MNRKQKTFLLAGIAVIVVMGLYPPWVMQTRERNFVGINTQKHKYTTEPGPYSWIGDPPLFNFDYDRRLSYDPKDARVRFIDLYRLGVQFFIVAVATAGLIIVFGDKKARGIIQPGSR